METNTHHRIRSIILLAHYPRYTSILRKSHSSSPKGIPFPSFSICCFVVAILIFYLQQKILSWSTRCSDKRKVNKHNLIKKPKASCKRLVLQLHTFSEGSTSKLVQDKYKAQWISGSAVRISLLCFQIILWRNIREINWYRSWVKSFWKQSRLEDEPTNYFDDSRRNKATYSNTRIKT